jgi:hypothetical protein
MGGGVQQSYTDTNFELATKSIVCDITEMEVAAMGVEVENTVDEKPKSFGNHTIMARAEDVASLVLPTLTCNRSVTSLQRPELFKPDLHEEGGGRYNSLGEITSSGGTKVGMVDDTPSDAQRAETSEGDISSLGFVEERRRGAALGCFREVKDDPNRQLTEPTFYTVKEKKGQCGRAGQHHQHGA